jgi:hypothetical protein
MPRDRAVMGHHGNATFNALVNIEHLRATENIVELSQSAQSAGVLHRKPPDEVRPM